MEFITGKQSVPICATRASAKRKLKKLRCVIYMVEDGNDWNQQAENGYPPGYFLNEAYAHCESDGVEILRDYVDFMLHEGNIEKGYSYGIRRLLKDAKRGLFEEVIFWTAESYWRADSGFQLVVEELDKLGIFHRSLYISPAQHRAACKSAYRPTSPNHVEPSKHENKVQRRKMG